MIVTPDGRAFDLSTESGRRAYARVVLRSPLGVPNIVTDTNFFTGTDDGFGDNQRMRELYNKRARSLGIDTTGKRYVPSLVARKELAGGRDPEAWVPRTNGRSHIKSVVQKRRWSCEGRVEVKAPDYEIPDDPKPYVISPDIVDKTVAMEIADKKLRLTPRERRALKEQTARTLVGNAND